MKFRSILFSAVFLLILFVFTELLLRLALLFYGYPFFQPSDYIYKGFYKELEPIAQADIQRDDSTKKILILGGSVVSSPWSHMEDRLDTILQKNYPGGGKFAIYNAALAGHTSLDNRIKYDLLDQQRFDLVLYYEAINETRANNIPPDKFRADYSHFKWYSDIYLLQAHPEINFTVIPYLFHKVYRYAEDALTRREHISQEKVVEDYVKYGQDIKTAASFDKNLTDIIQTARRRGDKLVLMTYTSYFPEDAKLTGSEQDKQHYAGCYFACAISIWGKPEYVKKGIAAHNEITRELASRYQVTLMPMAQRMPPDSSLFCDVCHVSELGAQYFAHQLAGFIGEKRLLSK